MTQSLEDKTVSDPQMLGHKEGERAIVTPGVKHPAKRAGGRRGGSNGRAVALIGVDGVPERPSLKTSEERLAVIEAILSAIVRGRTSGLAAQTTLAAIR